jgi:Flp pilus assembly pilin Flp
VDVARCQSAHLPSDAGSKLSHRPYLGRSGQGLVEYALILVVMAVVCVTSLVFFGDQLSSLLSVIARAV